MSLNCTIHQMLPLPAATWFASSQSWVSMANITLLPLSPPLSSLLLPSPHTSPPQQSTQSPHSQRTSSNFQSQSPLPIPLLKPSPQNSNPPSHLHKMQTWQTSSPPPSHRLNQHRSNPPTQQHNPPISFPAIAALDPGFFELYCRSPLRSTLFLIRSQLWSGWFLGMGNGWDCLLAWRLWRRSWNSLHDWLWGMLELRILQLRFWWW